ncbi:hypothetical protein DRQ07_01150 [candidate division KSB1 bacterium]|nr:MAG: hypothetical protein DRQ07_01150 [candidate division KSB1 bacterium]
MNNLKIKIFIILLITGQSILSGQIPCTLIKEKTLTPPVFGMSGKLEFSKTWITDKMLRRDDGKGNTKIVRIDKGVMWVINHNDSTYTELQREEFQGLAILGLMMFGVTFDTTTGEVIVPKPLLKKTGRKRVVNGYNCEEYVPASLDKNNNFIKSITMWVSKDTGLDQSIYINILKKMLGDVNNEYGDFYAQLQSMGGYPVRVETKMLGKAITQDFTGYEKVTVKNTFFDPPKGYKKKEGFFGPM